MLFRYKAFQLHGAYHGLIGVLGVCVVLNLGALFFSLRILTRGTQKHSTQIWTSLYIPT